MVKRADPNPEYWDEYTPFQQVKHDLIHNYLNGWYPKLGFGQVGSCMSIRMLDAGRTRQVIWAPRSSRCRHF